MTKPYLTVESFAQHEIDIKKSRFICTLAPIKSEDEAKEIIERISKENNKANHNCYAYLVGDHDQVIRESDNGEPSGTAGVPILEVLQKNHLHDTLAIVTRYFGGIKLGAGGLIRAYSNATSSALENIGIVQLVEKQAIEIKLAYNQLDPLNYFLNQKNLEIQNIDYTETILATLYISIEQVNQLIDELTNLFSGTLQFKLTDTKLFPIKYK